ncbi:hypothetical protein K1W69_24260 [Hoeflea sp. WL0058]|uniref:Uncharacterized protein n=1 Tax=Flavimaribacter sediminis TaxID=2865987 RepID=A0AAE3D418_9HYPH|nr:hypothetical protein [Flavimaribacter sediminis]MBW8640328.1 hypothetical protein [Flavimaribacter sediminis]
MQSTNVYFTTADGSPGTLLQACDLLNEAKRLADAVFMTCEAMSDYEAGAVQAVMLPLKSKMEDCHTIIDSIRGDKWSPDSELLKAQQEFIEADAHWRELVNADDLDDPDKDGAVSEALDKCKEIADRLFAMPASTMEGVAAKARVGELSGWGTDNPDPDHVLALTADLKRLSAR